MWTVQPVARGGTEHAIVVRGLRAEPGELWSVRRHEKEALVGTVWPAARRGAENAS